MRKRFFFLVFLILVLSLRAWSFAEAGQESPLSKAQTIYVPAYSHIYSGNREFPLLLTVTVSIRNVDLKHSITVTSADYYGTKGEMIKKMISQPVVLGPLESTRYVIARDDKAGGSGANFLVKWNAETKVNPPIIESIMIGAEGQQGISFTSRGQAIITSD